MSNSLLNVLSFSLCAVSTDHIILFVWNEIFIMVLCVPGPRLFLSCPGSLEGSQVWFTDLWNYSLVPYLVEAVREGLQLYGKRATWEVCRTGILKVRMTS